MAEVVGVPVCEPGAIRYPTHDLPDPALVQDVALLAEEEVSWLLVSPATPEDLLPSPSQEIAQLVGEALAHVDTADLTGLRAVNFAVAQGALDEDLARVKVQVARLQRVCLSGTKPGTSKGEEKRAVRAIDRAP